MIHISKLRKRRELSEQALADRAGLSRLTLRQLESGLGNPTIESIQKVAGALERDLWVVLTPSGVSAASDCSTVAVSMRVINDGFESWPLHFMELVDAFRKHWDLRLVLLPPVKRLDKKLLALMASICVTLCDEAGVEVPEWADRTHYLETPWFVSESNALRSFAITESPLAFRRNNIFVQDNFLQRA